MNRRVLCTFYVWDTGVDTGLVSIAWRSLYLWESVTRDVCFQSYLWTDVVSSAAADEEFDFTHWYLIETKKKTLHEPLWCFGYHYTVSEAQFAHQIGSHPRGVCTPVRTCTSGVDSVRVKRLCLVIGAGNFVQMTSLMLNKTKVYLACQKTGLPEAESQCPHISLCW